MADPQTPATPSTPPPQAATKPPAADPHIAPLTPEELSRFSGGGGGFTATTPINDGSVAPLTPDELKMFGGFTPPPLTGPPGSGHRPVPHPWADLFSAVTTGLGIAGGMMAAPELASATGLGAASDAIASGGANFMGRTVLPFLTRLAWRIPAAAGGAALGYAGGKAAAVPAGGPPPTVSGASNAAESGATGELAAGGVTAGMAGARNALAAAPDAVSAPFSAATRAYMDRQYGGPPLSGVVPTPAQIHPGRVRGFLEGIGRLSAVSDRFAQEDAANATVIKQAADGLIHQFGPMAEEGGPPAKAATPEEAGHVIKAAQRRAVGPPPSLRTPPGPPELSAAQATAAQTGAAATTATRDVTSRIGTLRTMAGPSIGTEATGALFKASANAAERSARDVSAQLYNTVDHLAGGATVSLDPLNAAADDAYGQGGLALQLQGGKLQSTLKTIIGAASDEAPVDEGTQYLRQAAAKASEPGAAKPLEGEEFAPLRAALTAAHVSPEDLEAGTITFGQAQELNSELGKQAYARSLSSDPHAANDQRVLLGLKDTVQSAMEQGAKAQGGEESPLWQAYQAATGHYRDVVGAYDRGILSTALQKEPRLVSQTLLQPGRVAEISDLWNRVGPEAKQAIQGQWIHDLIANPDGSPRDPAAIARELKQWDPRTLGAIFDRPTLQQLTDLGPSIDQAAQRTTEATAAQKALGKVSTAAARGTAGAATDFQKATAAHTAALAKVDAQRAPQVFARMLPKADVETVLKTRALVGGPQSPDWATIQSAHVQNLLYTEAGKLQSADKLAKALGPNNLPALTAIYGPDGVQTLQAIQRSIAMTGGGGKAGLGLMMRIGQGGALFGLGTAAAHFALGQPWEHAAGEAGTVLLAPTVLARIMTNPAARQWLTTGLEGKVMGDTTRWTRGSMQLANWLVQNNIIPAFKGSVASPPKTRPGAPPPPSPAGLGGRAGGPPPQVGAGGS